MAEAKERKGGDAIRDEVHAIWQEINEQRGEQSQLKVDLAGISQKLDALVQAVSSQSVRLDAIQNKQSEAGRTNWSTWAAMGALLLSIVVLGAQGWISPISVGQKAIEEKLDRHIAKPGHEIAMQLHAGISKDITRLDGDVESLHGQLEKLDTNLQREMRDLDTVQKTRIDNLDTVLQREMNFLADIAETKRIALESRDEISNSRLGDLEKRILSIEASRYSANDAKSDLIRNEDSHVKHAERLSKLEALLEKVVREQEQRTQRVYEKQ